MASTPLDINAQLKRPVFFCIQSYGIVIRPVNVPLKNVTDSIAIACFPMKNVTDSIAIACFPVDP
jgi:hypothetical protein